jgi:hypothetical protein
LAFRGRLSRIWPKAKASRAEATVELAVTVGLVSVLALLVGSEIWLVADFEGGLTAAFWWP